MLGGGARVWEKCEGWIEVAPAALGGPQSQVEPGPQGLLLGGRRRELERVTWSRKVGSDNTEGRASHKTDWAPAAGCREAAGVRVGCPVQCYFPTSCPLTLLLRPKDGPCRDQPLGNVHSMELGPVTTGEPSPLGE